MSCCKRCGGDDGPLISPSGGMRHLDYFHPQELDCIFSLALRVKQLEQTISDIQQAAESLAVPRTTKHVTSSPYDLSSRRR